MALTAQLEQHRDQPAGQGADGIARTVGVDRFAVELIGERAGDRDQPFVDGFELAGGALRGDLDVDGAAYPGDPALGRAEQCALAGLRSGHGPIA